MFKKSLLSLTLAAMLACSALFGCTTPAASSSNSTTSTESSTSQSSSEMAAMSVSIEFDIDLLEGLAGSEGAVPYRGPEEIGLPEGATAYDALLATGVKVDGTPSFVTSINDVGEGLAGEATGWMYMVNDADPGIPANECVLQEGDSVIWYYGTAGQPRRALIG